MIYFVKRSDGLVKIGCTANYYQRIIALKSEHGQLDFLGWAEGGMGTEKELHAKFAGCRVQGEWFTETDELKAHILLETNHELPPKKVVAPVQHKTLNEYLQEKMDESNQELLDKIEQQRIEIIKLEAKLEVMETLCLKLQDHSIDAALKFIKEHKLDQIKLVS